MSELFPGEPVLFFDSDILFNVSLDKLSARYAASNFVLADSTCMGIVSSDWLKALRQAIELFDRDIDGFARAVGLSDQRVDLNDPVRIDGSDQALVRLANAAKLLPQTDAPYFYWLGEEYLWSPSWLSLGVLGTELKYRRRGQSDLVNGKVMVASHLNNDFVTYLGAYLFVRELSGFNGFGRIPYPGASASKEANGANGGGVLTPERKIAFVRALVQLHEHRRIVAKHPLSLAEDPFSRRNVIERFYRNGDFTAVLNDHVWWEPGVWRR
jgi:hypothetical protein